ncbi:DUF4123 domain-containing protein [Marinomonas primoryensis]|jgi:hypothetical protein|uniref:DUF4123 domain-containing protein n=1 Tax=Marinomonas primoryensis TaxID=178399 RepID=UPI0037036F2B
MLDSFLADHGLIAQAPRMVAQQTYAIIEPVLESDLMKRLYQNGVADLLHAKLFADTEYRSLADKGPVIVQLSAENDSFAELMTAFEARPSGFFIHSGADFENVLAWARQRLTAQTSMAKALLRFYEPRMLLPLLGSLNRAEKACFLANIGTLYWFHHQWLSTEISLPSEEPTSAQNDGSTQREYAGLVLDSSYLNNMENIHQKWAEQQGVPSDVE